MSVLIVVDTKNGEVKKSSLEAAQYGASVAASLGGEAVALTLNANNAEVFGTVGVNKVLNVTDASVSASDPQKVVAAIVAAANKVGAKVVVCLRTIQLEKQLLHVCLQSRVQDW